MQKQASLGLEILDVVIDKLGAKTRVRGQNSIETRSKPVIKVTFSGNPAKVTFLCFFAVLRVSGPCSPSGFLARFVHFGVFWSFRRVLVTFGVFWTLGGLRVVVSGP